MDTLAGRFHKALLAFVVFAVTQTARASDHADGPLLSELGRSDARIADFYSFTRHGNLVLIMTLLAELPENYADFHFRSDVIYRFHIDRNAKFDEGNTPPALVIRDPESIQEDVLIEVRFGEGEGKIQSSGLFGANNQLRIFSGIRDEPFIRSTRHCKDLAAIVLELPLEQVVRASDQPIIIAWASTDLVGQADEQDDLAGQPYRSQLTEFRHLNNLHPSRHVSPKVAQPDVLVFDTRTPADFPNGRDLNDDVVSDLNLPVRDDPTHCGRNEWGFLIDFPYLADINKGRICPTELTCPKE